MPARDDIMTEISTTAFATNSVLDRFGKEIAEIIKKYLSEGYSIRLQPDCAFAIEEIAIALQRLFGTGMTKSLMQDITAELEELRPMTRVRYNINSSYWRVE
jgi:hypothetical protein